MIRGDAWHRMWHAARRMLCAGLVVFALPVADVDASTKLCRQLEAELASASGGAPSGQAGRYDAAIGKQQDQIRKARGQARQLGCGRGMAGKAVSQCASLNATLDRMQRNLIGLQGKRSKMGGSDSRRDRQRILAALDINGCRASERTLPPPVEDQPRVQAVIDGRTGLRIGGIPGSFRTLCVRTCDGYFFPVSYAVGSNVFERDANACKAMCPGAQVELHYHRVPGEEPGDMVSVSTGLPYTQMQNAYAYRETDAAARPGCGCNATATGERGFEIIGGQYAAPTPPEEATAALPSPSHRPDPAEDPETLANRAGGLDAETLKTLATPPTPPVAPTEAVAPEIPSDRAVRVVGPSFLPNPEEAIDLRAPAQPVAR